MLNIRTLIRPAAALLLAASAACAMAAGQTLAVGNRTTEEMFK